MPEQKGKQGPREAQQNGVFTPLPSMENHSVGRRQVRDANSSLTLRPQPSFAGSGLIGAATKVQTTELWCSIPAFIQSGEEVGWGEDKRIERKGDWGTMSPGEKGWAWRRKRVQAGQGWH